MAGPIAAGDHLDGFVSLSGDEPEGAEFPGGVGAHVAGRVQDLHAERRRLDPAVEGGGVAVLPGDDGCDGVGGQFDQFPQRVDVVDGPDLPVGGGRGADRGDGGHPGVLRQLVDAGQHGTVEGGGHPSHQLAVVLPARGGVADDPESGVEVEGLAQPGGRCPGAVGDDGDPRRLHPPGVAAAPGVHRHQVGPAAGQQHGVEDGPVRHAVGVVAHALGADPGVGHAGRIQVVAAEGDRCADPSVGDGLVDCEGQGRAFPVSEPAGPGGQALGGDVAARQADPPGDFGAFGEHRRRQVVDHREVVVVAGENHPPEGTDAAAEQRSQVALHETGDLRENLLLLGFAEDVGGLHPEVVAVLEHHRSALPQGEHGPHLGGHGGAGVAFHLFRVGFTGLGPRLEGVAGWQVAVAGVVGGGLVGHDVRPCAAGHHGGEHVGGVAQQPDGDGPSFGDRRGDRRQGTVEVVDHQVDAAGGPEFREFRGIGLHHQGGQLQHPRRDRLGGAHASQPRGEDPTVRGGGLPEVLFQGGAQQLVGASKHALPADVLPGGGRQPTPDRLVFRQAGVEPLLGGPVPHGVVHRRDHHRGGGVGVQHRHGPSGLEHQGLVLP